jgi:hypothetical protein|nr:MAG TPA: hypothetical protein [Caudoviricetes sp.]
MKIVHLASEEAYQLAPGTQLEVERTNLFFNDYGEQTLPVDLPDTDLNRKLTGYSDLLANRNKPTAKIECSIQDGEYYTFCRQAILGAQRHGNISTSFYMNEGAFLAKISDVSLKEIFGDEVIPEVSSIAEGINFCRSLITGTHPNYAIFPVLISDNNNSYKHLNRYGVQDNEGKWHDQILSGYTPDFYNATVRTETVDNTEIDISPGFYISPFIKANYLLKRIFQYFGYTLLDNFFTSTSPFPDMVFVNTCADSLVNGTIRIVDLLPDCMCSTILEVFRKKFFCEFIPNETEKTIDIKLFKECIKQNPTCDLSPYLIGHPEISFPESYKQLILSSENSLSDANSVSSEKSLSDLAAKYSTVEYDKATGDFYRCGYMYYGLMIYQPFYFQVREKVSPSSMRYYAGGDLETEEISVPDMQPEFREFELAYNYVLYIGNARFLNSKIVTPTSEEDADSITENEELKPMLAIAYNDAGMPYGTITNYRRNRQESGYSRMYDYSLCYNGPDGLFEKFYRPYDDILRNSLHSIKAKILLPDNLKRTLPVHYPVVLENQKLLINRLTYQIGGKEEPVESEFLTLNSYEPITSAKSFSEIIPTQEYEWIAQGSCERITEEQYKSSEYKDATFKPVYPNIRPSAELAASGKRYYERTTCLEQPGLMGGLTHYLVKFWMICQRKAVL